MTYRAKVLRAKNTSLVIEIDPSQMNELHHQLGALTSLIGIVDSRATFTPSVTNRTCMNHTYGPEDIVEIGELEPMQYSRSSVEWFAKTCRNITLLERFSGIGVFHCPNSLLALFDRERRARGGAHRNWRFGFLRSHHFDVQTDVLMGFDTFTSI